VVDHTVDHGATLGGVDGAVRLVANLGSERKRDDQRGERENATHGECS